MFKAATEPTSDVLRSVAQNRQNALQQYFQNSAYLKVSTSGASHVSQHIPSMVTEPVEGTGSAGDSRFLLVNHTWYHLLLLQPRCWLASMFSTVSCRQTLEPYNLNWFDKVRPLEAMP